MRTLLKVLPVMLLAACSPEETASVPLEDSGDGLVYDERPDAEVGLGKADRAPTYAIPEDLPELARPEVIVSLDGLTVHLFDREVGFSRVYPTGVGRRGSSGRSFTPAGFFRTHADPDDGWYWIDRRYKPSVFGGHPFLRLDAENSRGYHTYAFHGPGSYRCQGDTPIEGHVELAESGRPPPLPRCPVEEREYFLLRGYVSRGCMRMEVDDIAHLYWTLRDHSQVPVAIFTEPERDAWGTPVDLGTTPALFEVGEPIPYGECGERPDPYTEQGRWASKRCR